MIFSLFAATVLSLAATVIAVFGAVHSSGATQQLPGAVLGAATQQSVAFPTARVRSAPVPESVRAIPIRAVQPPTKRADATRLVLPAAHAAVVIDAASGAVLFDQNAHARRQIASLTKLFTAYIVRTSGVAMDAPVTIPAEALRTSGSRVGCKTSTHCAGVRLQEGEVVAVRDLLTAMLVASANDAALALAYYIAGSPEAFVALMNERAREIGLRDTRFCTPNGLEVDGQACYSTAADIARIAILALNDRFIWEQLNTAHATITSVDGATTHTLIATNEFAQTNAVPGMLGAKTGYTARAGKSLVMAAAHPDDPSRRIVAVLLGDPQRWEDIKTLIAWTWASYTWE